MAGSAVLFETHAHTPLCKHAQGDPESFAKVAARRNLRGIVFTCHNPAPPDWSTAYRMEPQQFDEYVALIGRARRSMDGVADVRLGLESDWLPGLDDYLRKLHRRASFEYILGSVHPMIEEYRARYSAPTALDYQRTYFELLAAAAETELFDALAHPDLVKNLFADSWDVRFLEDEIGRALDRIARTGVALEVNTSGLLKEIAEMNPGPYILREAVRRNIPIVIGGDAHIPERVGGDFHRALEAVQQAGGTQVSFFLGRKRQDVPVEAALASLPAR